MIGLSTIGSISLGCALVAGRKRVPRPAAGKTALRTFMGIRLVFLGRCAPPPGGGSPALARATDHNSRRPGDRRRGNSLSAPWKFPYRESRVVRQSTTRTLRRIRIRLGEPVRTDVV